MYDINDYVVKLDKLGKIIIYLRKSREDLIDGRYASDEETLARHEEQLQQWAKFNLGHEIPADCIYKEVGSGEKISTRPVFQEVLKKLEDDPEIEGILALNCSRLSRGDLKDCGTLIDILDVSETLVLTPQKVYNMKNKHDKRYFKDELLRGNDYLEQTKELLANGRHWSTSIGKFVGSTAPFGYDKVTCAEMKVSDGRGFTLRPNADSEYVKTMFEMYAEGYGSYKIATHLKEINAPLHKDSEWDHCKVKKLLKIKTYNGYLTWGERATKEKLVDGEKVSYRPTNKNCPIYKGLHTAIIDDDLFQRVQSRLEAGEAKTQSGQETKNPLAGIFKCAVCGKAMIRHAFYETKIKRKYEIDRAELQGFIREHKKKSGLKNAEIARRLNIKTHHVDDWCGKNPKKFHASPTLVENWFRLKEILDIQDSRFDDPVTVFEDTVKPDTLVCSGHRCSNISSYIHVVEDELLKKVISRFEKYNYFLDNYAEEITKKATNAKKALANIEKQISMKDLQIKNARIAYEQGADSLEEYIERKKELNDERNALIEKKKNAENSSEEEKTVTIKKAVPILKNVFESYFEMTTGERNDLLRTIMSSVMYIKGDDGVIDFDICWLV